MSSDLFLQKFDRFLDAPDAVAKLRELILQLAVTGKLVEQRAEEGCGQTLLRQILERHGLSDMQTKPAESDLAKLPENWAVSKIGEVAEIIRGVTFPGNAKSDIRSGDDVACLRTANVQAEIDWDDLIYISPTFVGREDQWIKHNDIIISMANSYALVGKVAIVRNVPIKTTLGGFLAAIRPILIEPYFLLYVLRSPGMQSAFRESSSQTTNIANISLGRMRPLAFPLPPLAEQRRIVAKVDELMALCDRLEAQLADQTGRQAALARAALERFAANPSPAELDLLFHPAVALPPADLRKSILSLAVQGKLVPQDPNDTEIDESIRVARKTANLPVRKLIDVATNEIPFNAPTSWRWVTVADVAETRLGKMLDKAKNRGEAHPYLRNTNVHWFRFELESIKTMLFESSELDEYRVEPGDVLICEGGHGIARSAVWSGQISGIMFQKALHRVRPLSCLNGHFLTFCLWVYEQNKTLHRYYTGAGIPHFTGKALAQVTFPLPPLAEQHRIVAKVDELMALVNRLEAAQTAAQTASTRLLDAAIAELTAAN